MSAPENASYSQTRLICRLLGHNSLEWTEEVTPLRSGATMTRLTSATCGCGRSQRRLLVRWPRPYYRKVAAPASSPGDETA